MHTMDKSVHGILKVPFSKRTKEERLKIILDGKPRPQLIVSSTGQKFDPTGYDKETWLTACDKQNAFYCWACLLFAREAQQCSANTNTTWITTGYDGDLGNLHEAIERHNMVSDHINAVLRLQLFIQQNSTNTVNINVPQPNETVKKHRDLLRRIIDLLRHVATYVPYPPKGGTGLQAHIKDMCFEVLSSCQNYGMDDAAEEIMKLLKDVKFVANVINTLSSMVKSKITEDTRDCECVSIILSEHSDISTKSKISAVLRYVKDGKVFERFVGFACKLVKKAVPMGNHMLDVLSQYEMKRKLIAFSCDGAVLPTNELQRLINRIHLATSFRSCHFVPCHFHRFDVVVEQSMSRYTKIALFFKTLTSIRNCLQKSPKMRSAFDDFMRERHNTDPPDLTRNSWNNVQGIRSHRKELVIFFKSVVHNAGEWTDDDVTKAMGFYKILEEFETIFLLEVFSKVFDRISVLCDGLHGSSPELLFEDSRIDSVLNSLSTMGLKGFPSLWKKACAEKSQSPLDSSEADQLYQSLIENGMYGMCRERFETIMTSITEEIKIRFHSRVRLTFFQLLTPEYQERLQTSCSAEICGQLIDHADLSKELKASEFLIKLSVQEKLEILSAKSLQGMFKNICKLAEIILTMPCKPACVRENTSELNGNGQTTSGESQKVNSTKLDVLNVWSTFISPDEEVTDINWSVIAIEQDIINLLVTQEHFFSDFVSRFQTLNSTLQLM